MPAKEVGKSFRGEGEKGKMDAKRHGASASLASHYDQPVADYYTFGDLLGKGSFADVYSATRKEDGKEVAIKAIDMHAANFEPGDLDIEIKVLMTVDHTNIIKLFEVFESSAHFYMVLEKIDGGELFDHIIERGHYSEATAAGIMKQLLDALAHMHDKNLVHRDLKPENLLYHEDPDGEITIKIADFGLSAVVDHNSLLTVACGSPGYVAPEILLQRPYDEAVDAWSAGVILYILLSGLTPFAGETDQDLYKAIVTADYSFDGPEWNGISDGAKELITGLLDLNPKSRLSPAQALRSDWITSDAPDMHLANLVVSIMSWQKNKEGRSPFVHAKLLKWASTAKAGVKARSNPSTRSTSPVGRAGPSSPSPSGSRQHHHHHHHKKRKKRTSHDVTAKPLSRGRRS